MCGNTLFFSSRCKQKILATLYENPREENSPTSRGKNECTMERTIYFDSGIFFVCLKIKISVAFLWIRRVTMQVYL